MYKRYLSFVLLIIMLLQILVPYTSVSAAEASVSTDKNSVNYYISGKSSGSYTLHNLGGTDGTLLTYNDYNKSKFGSLSITVSGVTIQTGESFKYYRASLVSGPLEIGKNITITNNTTLGVAGDAVVSYMILSGSSIMKVYNDNDTNELVKDSKNDDVSELIGDTSSSSDSYTLYKMKNNSALDGSLTKWLKTDIVSKAVEYRSDTWEYIIAKKLYESSGDNALNWSTYKSAYESIDKQAADATTDANADKTQADLTTADLSKIINDLVVFINKGESKDDIESTNIFKAGTDSLAKMMETIFTSNTNVSTNNEAKATLSSIVKVRRELSSDATYTSITPALSGGANRTYDGKSYDSYATEITATLSDGDIKDNDFLKALMTFGDRYLYFMLQSGSPVPYSEYTTLYSTLYEGSNSDAAYIMLYNGYSDSLAEFTPAIKNADTYSYVMQMQQELYYFYKKLQSSNDASSTKKKYLEGLQSINDLRMAVDNEGNNLFTDYLETMWTHKEGDNTKSLQEIYTDLLENEKSGNGLDNLGNDNIKLNETEPLTQFLSVAENQLNTYYLTGISYSATYIPLKTNVYDPYTLQSCDTTFLEEFHYKYGFNRKALYIDKNSDSAQQLHVSGSRGATRVATLRDLINPAGDVVLYLDDNLYNADDLAETLDIRYNRVDNVGDKKTDSEEDGIVAWIKDTATEIFDIPFKDHVKTAEATQYSQKLRNKIANVPNSGYIETADRNDARTDNTDDYVLTSGEINDILDMTEFRQIEDTSNANVIYDDYNPLQAYAVVSSLYRDASYFAKANSTVMKTPVFIASGTVPNMSSTTQSERNEIFNWLLLKNLKSCMPVGYTNNLDMDNPVYTDIYGNILTESGDVVIPAAANATLYNDDYYDNIYNFALPYTYGSDYELELDNVAGTLQETLDSAFQRDESLNVWKIRAREVNVQVDTMSYNEDSLIDFARLSIANKDTIARMSKAFEVYLVNSYNFNKFFNIAIEVMRGAPIDSIDKEYEGLNLNMRTSKAGLLAAAKLETLQKDLRSGEQNAVLALPNMAFVDGFEYIVLFAFKALMIVVIITWMLIIYTDMVSQKISIRTVWKLISSVLLTVLTIISVPTVFDITYYQSNKLLLKDEVQYLAMLNREKEEAGIEIGIYDLQEPETSTELYIKLDDINVPWYSLFDDIMLKSTWKSVKEIYADYGSKSTVSNQSDVKVMNDGVYVNLDTVLNSASIDIDTDTNYLKYSTDETTTLAFYSPYYSVLESLIAHVNNYNKENNWKSYTTKTNKGGAIKTVGAISAYFNSTEFMESEGDVLNFYEIYNEEAQLQTIDVFSDEAVATMSKTQWYNKMSHNVELQNRINILSDEARDFVATNQQLLGKISDDTFLKIMALDIAIKHNEIFGVHNASSIEIMQLSNDDLMRLVMADRNTVMINSTETFSRFCYETTGAVGIYLAAVLVIVNFITGWIKPLCTIIAFIAIFGSIFIFKVCLKKKTSSLYGYVVTTLYLCMANILHALLLKLCMLLPNLKLGSAVCIIIYILSQIWYTGLLIHIVYTALRDWQDLGFARNEHNLLKRQAGADELKNKVIRFFKKEEVGSNNGYANERSDMKPKNNWAFYDDLKHRKEERQNKYGR